MWLAEPAQSAEAYVGERWPDIQAAAGFARAWLDVVLLSGIDTSVMNLGTTPLALGGPLYVEWTSEWRSADRSAYDPVEWIPEFDQWTPEFEFLAANWPSVATAAGISRVCGQRHGDPRGGGSCAGGLALDPASSSPTPERQIG